MSNPLTLMLKCNFSLKQFKTTCILSLQYLVKFNTDVNGRFFSSNLDFNPPQIKYFCLI